MPTLPNQPVFKGASNRVDQYFYPSCVARLVVRLEETFQPEQQTMPTPLSIDDAIFNPTTQTLSPSATTLPTSQSAGGRDDLTFQIDRIPKTASIELPGYRKAGRFSMTFDYRDLPMDPRQIRAIGTQIHLGTVSGYDFAQGIVAPLALGGRSSVLRIQDVGGQPNPATLLQVGTVDDVSFKHDKECSEFTISGRDLTGLLLDCPIRPEQLAQLKLKLPIDQVVRQILSFNQLIGQAVDVRPNSVIGTDPILTEWDNNTPLAPAASQQTTSGLALDVTRVRLGVNGSTGNPSGATPGMSAPGAPNNVNMWDMITRYCFLVGAVPYFVGQVLWIRRARNLFDTLNKSPQTVIDPNRDQPFHGTRTWTTANTVEQLKVRRLVYGQDILDLQMERKIGGVTKPVIELVCMNTSSNQRGMATNPSTNTKTPAKLLVSQYPQNPKGAPTTQIQKHQRSTKVSPTGNNAMTDILRIPVHGISSQARLDQMAQDIWTEIAYQELGGSFTTRDLSSLGGGNSDPDLLRLRPGDPVEILIRSDVALSQSPVNAELIRLERQLTGTAQTEYMKRLGLQATAADALARTKKVGVPGMQNFYRVTNVKFTWSHGEGVIISANFQNYVTALTAGTAQTANATPAVVTTTVPGPTVPQSPTNTPALTTPSPQTTSA
jgi:hypothetical protein